MSCMTAARALAVALVVTPLAHAQRDAYSDKAPNTPPVPFAEPVRLPEDTQARQKLAAADDYIKVQAWGEATRLLQSALDARGDSFRRVTYRDQSGRASQRWTSLRAEAERLLANLPKAGKDFYLLTYEARARKELADARTHNDPAALHEVARRFRFTGAGVEALERLGSYYLDRGHADLADVCFQQLLRHPGADHLSPTTLFKVVLAARGAGERREEVWQKLLERIGKGGLQLGSDTYDTDKLRQMVDRWPGGTVDNSLVYRSDPARTARGHGDFFLLEPRWRFAAADGDARQWLAKAERSPQRLVLPAATPLAVDGKVIYRAADGLHAFDAETGRPLWHSPSRLSLAGLLAEPSKGPKVQLQDWLRRYGPADALLAENSTLGTLSSDGRHVYAIEDLPLPPHPDLLQNGGTPLPPLGPLRYFVGYNRLRAVEISSGKVVWEIGGSTIPNPPLVLLNWRELERLVKQTAADPLSAAYFLGPPLSLGGQLFALVEKQQELSLVCLDAARGEVRWTQMLATAREKMALDVVRHTQAAHLAYADGVLVCPTHAGAVLGFDPLSRGLLWAHVYAKPPAIRDDGVMEVVSPPLRAGWRGCAPILHAGRVVFAPPDDEGLYCLGLRDGALLWKTTRTEDDLYVGCVHKNAVLVVGKTACRALSLDSGRELWRQSTGAPAGQGVHDGSLYYLPLKDGSILSLNLEQPGDSMAVQSRGVRGDLGNLVFHRGTLWSQNATELIALTTLTAQLAHVEQRLARSPHDPALLFERGRLRQDRGDFVGAVADLQAALAGNPSAAVRTTIRDRLFVALTHLLQRDFDAGEKYLDEYQALCRVPIPSSAGPTLRQTLEKERERRQSHYLALVALGRQKQGRVLDALHACRALVHRSGELMTAPDEPGARMRPELWAQGRVAALFAHATPPQRQLLREQIHREAQALSATSDRTALRRFVTLFGSVEGEDAGPIGEARLRLAGVLARASGRRHALEAELLLHGLQGNESPALRARALDEQGRLLTRAGLLAESVAVYRRLAKEYGATVVHDGKTGAQLLDELRTDKRFLVHLEPKVDPWTGHKLTPLVTPRGSPLPQRRPACVPCLRLPRGISDPTDATNTLLEPVSKLPYACRRLRFTIDVSRLQLLVADRATGAELYAISLPLVRVPMELAGEVCYYQAVDHLLVLCLGSKLLGVDLLERRVRWIYSLQVDPRLAVNTPTYFPMADGGTYPNVAAEGLWHRLGLLGPVGPTAVCVQTQHGLIALDPASGDVLWDRTDVSANLSVFGDEEYLFLVERSGDGTVRGVRAVRARDGASVTIPDAVASCANMQRVFGRLLLVAETGPDERRTLRLYDPLTGKDLWRKSAHADAILLQSSQRRWLGIVEPGGTVTVVDLAHREEVAHLSLDPRHLDKVRGGSLLLDREQFYVTLQGPIDPELKMVGEARPNFYGLASVPVNGMVYAFGRSRGELRWYNWLPLQALLLDQFEDIPILLCSAVSERVVMENAISVFATRSLNKRTGKLLFNREVTQPSGALFHALRIDPVSGSIDLLSAWETLRHTK